MGIIFKLPEMRNFHAMTGASDDQIRAAEQALALSFSKEYRDYLSSFGAASCYGHELTGICDFSRLSVVDVTSIERTYNPTVPANWYVVEQAHIDGIVIWQSDTGAIYQTTPNAPPVNLCGSLGEYLDL